MTLDLPTVMLVGAFVSALCGAFLLFTWWENRQSAAPLWWAVGFLVRGCGGHLIAIGIVGRDDVLIGAGLTLLMLSPALMWSGLRAFAGAPPTFLFVCLGPVAWLIPAVILGITADSWIIAVVNAVVEAAYGFAIIAELARQRAAGLRASIPLMVLTGVNFAVLSLAVPAVFIVREISRLEPTLLMNLFGFIHLETIAYAIGSAIFLVQMMRERFEQHHRRNADTDVLTGLANRRAFLDLAERMVERCRRRNEPFSTVVFDLDHFKQINDSFGHSFGDDVLRVFARVAREALRPGDLVGRVGGEEFFAVLPSADLGDGRSVAERVRKAFEEAAASISGRDVKGTVSAGVAVGASHDLALGTLFDAADAALYRAKLNGRNRVECGEAGAKPAYPRLVRVA